MILGLAYCLLFSGCGKNTETRGSTNEENIIIIDGQDVNHMKNVLRLKIGEQVMVNGGDNKDYQANLTRDALISHFAQPLCEKIVVFTVRDFNSKPEGTQAIITHEDFSLKPSGYVYQDLVYNKWWTRDAKATTGADGKATVRGFYGDYDVTVTHNGVTKTVEAAYHKGYNNTLEIVLD